MQVKENEFFGHGKDREDAVHCKKGREFDSLPFLRYKVLKAGKE